MTQMRTCPDGCNEPVEECVGSSDCPLTDDDIDDDLNDDEETDCSEVLEFIYSDCGFAFVSDGDLVSAEEAADYCKENVGNWSCVFECQNHSEVDSCEELGECLEERCDMPVESTTEQSSSDDDDDDDSGGKCGLF